MNTHTQATGEIRPNPNQSILATTDLDALPIDAAIDDYEALGVRLEHLTSVFKLVIQCQSSSDPKVIVGALYAVESLLEVVGTSFCQLGTAMMEARQQAVQAQETSE